VTVRLSSYSFDQVPDDHIWTTRSASHTRPPEEMKRDKDWKKVYFCPAAEQGGECKSCRACWNRSVPVVSYGKH